MRVLLIDHTAPTLEVDTYNAILSQLGEEVIELPKRWDGTLPACDAALLLGLSRDSRMGECLVRGFKRRLGRRPLFVVTGHADERVIASVLKAGAEKVFTRPVNRDEVVFFIRNSKK